MDLLSLVLTLRPAQLDQAPAVLPLWWGRAAQALLLQVVKQTDPELAEEIHGGVGGSEPRPFTVSTLMGRFPDGKLDQERPYTLRFTALSQKVADLLWASAQDGLLSPGALVELDHLPFRIEAVQPDGTEADSPWVATGNYQEFGAAYLLARQEPPRRVALQFTSPTTFKSGGQHMPIPLPHLAFGSLLRRWNAFGPITFPEEETLRYAAECLAISRYQLTSRSVRTKGRGLRIGGVGQVTYATTNYDRYWMSVISVLAEYALFAGIGAGTAMGLGQSRLKTEEN